MWLGWGVLRTVLIVENTSGIDARMALFYHRVVVVPEPFQAYDEDSDYNWVREMREYHHMTKELEK